MCCDLTPHKEKFSYEIILLFSILHNFFFKESGNPRRNHISLLKIFRKEIRLKKRAAVNVNE